jgi:CBS domain containing-hemolysin-like protein
VDGDSGLQLAVAIVGFLFVVFGAAAESASLAVSRARLHHLASEGSSRAAALSSLLDEPAIYTATTVVIRTVGILLTSAMTVLLALRFAPTTLPVVLLMVI